ncbi:cytochrome P450 [Bacillus sp. es.034]|uniref:cytochrome P450 n=1 Tax=Bacillus sp. es.034 TaxID=1761763 RepID=UPI000BF74A95|nr:cytochrome P450 [Bacillus sp. es.034]PFG04496.1 cytochrome P450 [Bacillus sp. es.034]
MGKLHNPTMAQITKDRFSFYNEAIDQSAPIWSDDADAWLLFNYDLVSKYMKDERFIANRKKAFVDSLDILSDHKEILTRFYNKWLMYMDNPEHQTLKKKVQTPIIEMNSLASLLSKEVSRKLLDSMLQANSPSVDVIKEMTIPFTNEVLSGVLGISCKLYKEILQEATNAVSFLWSSNPSPQEIDLTVSSINKTYDLLNHIIDEHLYEENKLLDMILKTVEDREDRLAIIANITVDGHEPFFSSINSFIFYYLHCLPKEMKNKSIPVEKLVNETLRLECPFPFCSRIAREDVTIESKTIKKGEKAIFLISAANRDSEKFHNPDHISLDSPTKKTLTFGTGSHFCSGAMLTTVSLQEFAKEFIAFQDIRELKVVDYKWNDSFGFRSLRNLNITVNQKKVETASLHNTDREWESGFNELRFLANQKEYKNR